MPILCALRLELEGPPVRPKLASDFASSALRAPIPPANGRVATRNVGITVTIGSATEFRTMPLSQVRSCCHLEFDHDHTSAPTLLQRNPAMKRKLKEENSAGGPSDSASQSKGKGKQVKRQKNKADVVWPEYFNSVTNCVPPSPSSDLRWLHSSSRSEMPSLSMATLLTRICCWALQTFKV